jgi:hypothetical protein
MEPAKPATELHEGGGLARSDSKRQRGSLKSEFKSQEKEAKGRDEMGVRRGKGTKGINYPVLMVDQLWLWILEGVMQRQHRGFLMTNAVQSAYLSLSPPP